MKKLNFVLILVVAFMVLVVAGCKPATIVVPPPVVDDNNPPVNPPSGNDELNASQQAVVKSAISAVMKEIGTITGAAEGTWSNDTYEGEYSLTMDNNWTINAWGDKKTNGASLLSMSAKTGTHDIEFTITKAAAEGTGTIEVILDGETYTSEASEIVATEDVPEEAEAMTSEEKSALKTYIIGFGHDRTILDFDYLLAGTEVSGMDKIGEPEKTATTYTMSLKLTDYDYDGDHGSKTMAGNVTFVLTGEDSNGTFEAASYAFYTDENGVTFKGGSAEVTAVINKADPVSGIFSSKAIGGIELKLSVEEKGIAEEDLKVVKFQAPTKGSVGAKDKMVESVVTILGLTGSEEVDGLDADDLTAFAAVVMNPQHLRTYNRLDSNFWDRDETFSAKSPTYSNGTLTFDITFNGYKFAGSSTVSGNASLSFSGEVDENHVLKATRWSITSDESGLTVGSDNAVLYGISGNFVLGTALGDTETTLDFQLNDSESSYENKIVGKNGSAQTPGWGDETKKLAEAAGYEEGSDEYKALETAVDAAVKNQPKFGMKSFTGYAILNGEDKVSSEMLNSVIGGY